MLLAAIRNSIFRSIVVVSRSPVARPIKLDHGQAYGPESRDSRDRGTRRRVRSITDMSARAWRESCSDTVVASPSAAYGIAHDTETAGSLALEVNLSRGFAGSRVKFLRMHRRLPSLLIPAGAHRSRRPPSRSTLRYTRFLLPPRSLARPFIPRVSLSLSAPSTIALSLFVSSRRSSTSPSLPRLALPLLPALLSLLPDRS